MNPSPTSRFRPSWFVGLGVVLLAVSLIGASKSINSTDPPASVPAKSPSSEVRGGGFGHVDAERGPTNVHAKQPGIVVQVFAEEGEELEKDAPLFRMDDTLARADWLRAKAAVDDAGEQVRGAWTKIEQHAALLDAQKAAIQEKEQEIKAGEGGLPRARDLQKKGHLSEDELKALETRVSALRSALEAEKAKLRALKAEIPMIAVNRALADLQEKEQTLKKARYALDECTVRAPYKGKVLRMFVNVGTMVGPPNPQMPAAQFVALPPYIVRAEIDQEFAARVEKGQIAEIQDDARAGAIWTGRVKRVGDWYTHRRSMLLEPLQFNDVRTLEVIIEMDDPPPNLRIGQRVRVSLQ